jgi:hypothetical protein
MMKDKRGFRVPHQLGYFASNLAVGDRNLVDCDRHWVFSCWTIPQGLGRAFDCMMEGSLDVASMSAAAGRQLHLLGYAVGRSPIE